MADEADELKETLLRYLTIQREVALWKLDGLSERDARRPVTPTGTNVLGLVKHLAAMELAYFGEVFERPSDIPQPWFDDGAGDNADMYATADESIASVTELYRASIAHSNATIEALPLDATGFVRWWAEGRAHPTLHGVLVHMTVETARHAGHADIVRELLDGAAGFRVESPNLPEHDDRWWAEYVAKLTALAEAAD